MHLIVQGAAAGGGFPQWNCGCANCARARSGDPAARPRTQAQLAVSPDGARWTLIGASPDLRQQILATQELAPPAGTRHSPVDTVVLISADVDGIAGLLALREQHRLRILAPRAILDILAGNSLFASLDPALVVREALAPGQAADLGDGMTVRLLPMPGKVPLYQEDRQAARAEAAPTYAARLDAKGRVAIAAPGCAEITPAVLEALAPADLLLFDGTLYDDEEMIRAGMSAKTSRRMGHVPLSGAGGSLTSLAGLRARRIFFHINNTNPILLDDSPERAECAGAGFEVAYDGMRITL